MIDELGGSVVRVMWWILSELFFGTVCYFIGWPVCKLLTLGRYPSSSDTIFVEYSRYQEGWPCAIVGLVTLLGLVTLGVNIFA